jgi:hypothetical protein
VVKWGLEYSWANIGSSFPNTTTVYTDSDDETVATEQGTALVASDHFMSLFDEAGSNAISGTGKTISSMFVARIFRNSSNADDTYASKEAILLEFDLHYEVDSLGSQSIGTKGDAEENRTVSVYYDTDDTVAENSIQLRVHASPHMLVNDANKLKITLFFIPAVR